MRYEISAGVILFRHQPQRAYLILNYGSHWDFPKGHIEPGEDPAATARRELHEETGIQHIRVFPGFRERAMCGFSTTSFTTFSEKYSFSIILFIFLAFHGSEYIKIGQNNPHAEQEPLHKSE